jgi:glyceraldehyde 3-phosphate dehydrogenase
LDNDKYNNARAFVIDKLKNAKDTEELKPKDVVLYGFGRIGRLLAREMMSKVGKGQQLRLRAIVTRDKKGFKKSALPIMDAGQAFNVCR